MHKNTPWLIGLAAITALAAFFRFYLLDRLPPGLWLDEAMNGIDALRALRSGVFGVFYPENGGREGLYMNLQALSLAVFGVKPWSLRLVSAAFGTLTVPAVYLLAVELFGGGRSTEPRRATAVRWLGLTSAFFMAVSLWHVMASRIGLRVVAAPFFLTWSMYLLLRALNQAETAVNRRVWPGAIAAGLIYGLGFHSYIAYRVTPLIALLVFWDYWRRTPPLSEMRRRIATAFWCFVAAAALIVAPLAVYFAGQPQALTKRMSEIAVWSLPDPTLGVLTNMAKTTGMFFFYGDNNWRSNFSGRAELYWPLGLLFIVGVAVAALFTAKRAAAAADPDLVGLGRRFAVFGAAYSLVMPILSLARGDLRPPEIWLLIVSLLFLVPGLVLLQVARLPADNRAAMPLADAAGCRAAVIALGWLLVAALPSILSSEELPHAPRSLLMVPAVFILAALGAVILFWSGAELWRARTRAVRIIRLTAAALALILTAHVQLTYFILWGRDPNSQQAFLQDWVRISEALNDQPDDWPKFVVVRDPEHVLKATDAMLYPIMFLTDTYSPAQQQSKNLHYLLPGDATPIPDDAFVIAIDAAKE